MQVTSQTYMYITLTYFDPIYNFGGPNPAFQQDAAPLVHPLWSRGFSVAAWPFGGRMWQRMKWRKAKRSWTDREGNKLNDQILFSVCVYIYICMVVIVNICQNIQYSIHVWSRIHSVCMRYEYVGMHPQNMRDQFWPHKQLISWWCC